MNRIAAILGVALLAGCGDPASIAPDELVGSWVETQPLSPRGTMDRILTFGGDGRFWLRVESYGVYPEQAESQLSAWSETRGPYEIDEDRLYFEPRTTTWYDTFYEDPGPFTHDAHGTLFDQAVFEVRDDELVLHYLTYPVDAPVETTMRLKRL